MWIMLCNVLNTFLMMFLIVCIFCLPHLHRFRCAIVSVFGSCFAALSRTFVSNFLFFVSLSSQSLDLFTFFSSLFLLAKQTNEGLYVCVCSLCVNKHWRMFAWRNILYVCAATSIYFRSGATETALLHLAVFAFQLFIYFSRYTCFFFSFPLSHSLRVYIQSVCFFCWCECMCAFVLLFWFWRILPCQTSAFCQRSSNFFLPFACFVAVENSFIEFRIHFAFVSLWRSALHVWISDVFRL